MQRAVGAVQPPRHRANLPVAVCNQHLAHVGQVPPTLIVRADEVI
jgi:hypothetical protein